MSSTEISQSAKTRRQSQRQGLRGIPRSFFKGVIFFILSSVIVNATLFFFRLEKNSNDILPTNISSDVPSRSHSQLSEEPQRLERRAINVPIQLKRGRLNTLNIKPWMANWLQYQLLDKEAVGDLSQEIVMDLVYTWVNGSERAFWEMKEHYKDHSALFRESQASLKEGEEVRQVAYQGESERKGIARGSSNGKRNYSNQTENRYRDMDELKYSMRSVAEYTTPGLFRKAWILTTEVVIDAVGGEKRGQIPQWLDIHKLDKFKDMNYEQDHASELRLELIPHTRIYGDQNHLPSFNSLSIESQMHNIPGLADIYVYLNDDVFFGKPLGSSDFWTPLYGFVFHMDPNTVVPPYVPVASSTNMNVGEWSSLQYTNSILSKQFGPRHRVYIAHIPHILSVPLLEEIQSIWPEEFSKTSSHRFRGEGEAHDLQVSFLMAHYVMERLRETQLTSYWRYHLDKNQDGRLDWEERSRLIRIVEEYDASLLKQRYHNHHYYHHRHHHHHQQQQQQYHQQHQQWHLKKRDGSHVHQSSSSFLNNYSKNLEDVNIPWSKETTYALTGLDEYPFMLVDADTSKSANRQHTKPYQISERRRFCKLDLDFCFGMAFRDKTVQFLDATLREGSIFERLAFTEFHCGDCLLHIIRQQQQQQQHQEQEQQNDFANGDGSNSSGNSSNSSNNSNSNSNGSSSSNSRSNSSRSKPSGGLSGLMPLKNDWEAFQLVLRDLSKYNYVIGSSHFEFVQLRNGIQAQESLDRLMQLKHQHAFFCINDDVQNNPLIVQRVRRILGTFLEKRFPVPSPWEKKQG
ncbi:hypothetical protein BCR41DRAFT_418000 [Lobosporangium transversale]|uniref:Stealth protein CR3 conserved region 3 domain-containing protein n=1 Tax=Lobosporangium transversale TaxID=64571 RepID=A0A1Y2H2X7_9FUNG|nr:hypothetical protein BCR41DRAFT_418000 [Lobosporangium transversale]ORZ28898.1 hypothetical protein BCR41DRAFT_418000 [Lobosporangium transversale]|eukprot:XP_021886571.1 hypothetical protein BCR41DRAFT_418000 [Lobosporangium transversale]